MKKSVFVFLCLNAILVLILSVTVFLQYRSLNQRPDSDSMMYLVKHSSEVQCKKGVKDAIDREGFSSDVPIYCVRDRYRRFDDDRYDLQKVRYDVGVFEDIEFDRYVPIISFPNDYIFVFPRGFTNFYRFSEYVSEKARVPFSGLRNNFIVWQMSKISVKKEKGYYCFVHKFQFPFVGEIEQCPKMLGKHKKRRMPYTLNGEVSLVEGLFTWEEALDIARLECSKYSNAMCKSQVDLEHYNRFDYWGGHEASTAVDIPDGEQTVRSYLFAETIYKDNGKEGMVFVQVFADGKVKSQEITKKVYSSYGLFKMAKKFNGS